MEQPIKTKEPFSHIIKGMILVALVAITSWAIEKTTPHPSGWMAYLPTCILLGGVALSGMIFSHQKPTKIFADIFGHGFKTTAVVVCLLAMYTFVSVRFINKPPDAGSLEEAKKELLKSGNMMATEADQKLAEALKNRWVFLVAQSIFVSLIAGTIGAGVGALISSGKQTGTAQTIKQ